MYIEGLDALDNKILEIIKNNARATFSEIGEMVGLSRVAVKNRMEAMEKKGIIQGYKTVINPAMVPGGVKYFVDVETLPENYQDVADILGDDKYLRQIYRTTGDCRMHAIGFAPNIVTLEKHVNQLFKNTKGIRKITCNLLLTTMKDVEGGVEYERYKEPEDTGSI